MLPALGCLLLVLLNTATLSGLDPTKAITQYGLDRWTRIDGLPQNSVGAITQTRDGYLWFGTEKGLVRFDGVRFSLFNSSTSTEFADDFVDSLFEDRDGTLWIATLSCLVSLRDGTWASYELPADYAGVPHLGLGQAPDRALWVGSGERLGIFRGGKIEDFTDARGSSIRGFWDVVSSSDGSQWFASHGLYRLAKGELSLVCPVPENIGILCIATDRDGTNWFGTAGAGLGRLQNGTCSFLTTRDGLASDNITDLLVDRHGSLWIGTLDQGLQRYSDGELTAFTEADGLCSNQIMSLYEDREGSLWIGTTGGGLNRLRDGACTTYSTREGLKGGFVQAVCEGTDGSVWIGTNGGGLSRLKDGTFIASYVQRDGLSNDSVTCLLSDRRGVLWIGTGGGGVSQMADGKVRAYSREGDDPGHILFSIYEDRAGIIWMGTDRYGLWRLRDQKVGQTPDFSAYPLCMKEDRQGTLWVGTNGDGLIGLANGHTTTYTEKEGLSSNVVVCLHNDQDGVLWIGTAGGGLCRLANGKLTRITTKQGLFSDAVYQILEDSRGNLWMGCNDGIFCVSKRELNRVAEGSGTSVTCMSFDETDAMRNRECNGGGQNYAMKSRDGALWFATVNGVVRIDPERLGTNPVPPPVHIEQLLVNGRVAGGNGKALPGVLPPGSTRLEFQYTGLSFLKPSKVRFRYRLDGLDTDWIDAGSRRQAFYTNVPPGAYTFRVIAANSDGVWNRTGASLDFRIKPFYYQTRWFLFLCVSMLAAAGVGSYRIRVRRMKERQRELERIVEARTRDLHAANEELRRVQEQLERLSKATPDKIENVSGWGALMAEEIVRVIHARRIRIYRAEGARLVPLSGDSVEALSWEAVQTAGHDALPVEGSGERIIPVRGMSGELRGALVIEGAVAWSDLESRVVTGFADHLGSALDLRHLREQLTVTEARQAAARARMQERGIRTVKVCPRCGRCEEDTADQCPADGSRLDASRLLPYRFADRYRLSRLLGEGGMGSVFAAHDEKLARDVAMKVIKAELLQNPEVRFRIEREARVLAQLHHPSVISLFDSGELEDGSAFLVMELLKGRDLAGVLKDHGPGSPRQVALLLRQAGAALGAAHRAGIFHRDVKPANLVLEPDRDGFRVKVLDFGLAKAAGTNTHLTQTGVRVGTPAYMSPEQVQGFEADERSDLYSLAAVIYEALTGRCVAQSDGAGNMVLHVLYTMPPRASTIRPGLSSDIDGALEAALAKNRSERPADVVRWSESLAALLDGLVEAPGGPAGWPLQTLETAGPAEEEPPSSADTRVSAGGEAEAQTTMSPDRAGLSER